MANIYIDPSQPVNGTGTIENPFNTWVGITWVAGNSYLQKAGTTFTTAIGSAGRIAPSTSGTINNRILISSYGIGSKPKIYNRADTAFNLDRRSYITLENFEIDNTEATAAAIGGGGDTAAESIGIIVRNNHIHSGNVEGMSFITQANRLGTLGLVVKNNLIQNVGGHGIIVAGDHFLSLIENNTINKCGFASPKHGISSFAHRATSTPSWTLVSGTIYKTTIGAQTFKTVVTDIYGVLYRNTGKTLARASVSTSPNSQEFGFSAGELYINIGGVPSGQITFSYSNLSVIFKNNTVSNVVDFDGNEGHGIQLDDLSSDSFVQGNFIYNCQGRGIQVNMGRRNIISSNIVKNCIRGGIRIDVNGAVLNSAYNNTIFCNYNSVTGLVGMILGENNTAKNNIIIGFETGITGTSTSTEDFNVLNTLTERSGGIIAGSNTLTENAQIKLDSFSLKETSPCVNSGTFLNLQDKFTTTFWNTPSRGAIEFIRTKTIRS